MNRSWPLAVLLALLSQPARACWVAQDAPGALVFVARQPDGTAIRGDFTRFNGRVCLAPADPGAARVRVRVATASVDTGLPEQDDALRGPVFLDSTRWPAATFVGASVQRLDDSGHYRVRGSFTLRGVSRELDVPFTLTISPDGHNARLQGRTVIRRLDFGVGQGQWADTQWAADAVTLALDVQLRRETPGALESSP